MKKELKSVISIAVAASMLAAMTGCADKANEQVIEAADSYASAVASMDYKKFAKCVSEDVDGDMLETLELVMGGDLYEDDAADIIDAVKSTITYVVDEESVDASTKDEEGEIDITFTMADLEAVIDDEDNVADLDTLLDAIEDADTTEVTITVPFVLEDEEWKVSDVDNLEDVYDFIEVASEISFAPNLIECIDYAEWWFDDDDNGTYTNSSVIDLQLNFIDGTDTTGVNYTITYNGTEIYSADGTDAWVYGSSTSVTLEDDYYYPAGSYVITFFDADGNELYSGTANVIYDASAFVEETEAPAETESGSGSSDVDLDAMASGQIIYLESSSDFYFNTSVATFYDMDADSGCDAYNSGVSAIQLTCEALDGFSEVVYYGWYYSAEGSSDDAVCVFEDTVGPTAYNNGDFYDLTYEDSSIADGSYWCIVASADETVTYQVGYVVVG